MKITVTFELDTSKNTLRMSGDLTEPGEQATILVTNPGMVQVTRAMLGQLIEHVASVGYAEQVQGNGDSTPRLIVPTDEPDAGQSD